MKDGWEKTKGEEEKPARRSAGARKPVVSDEDLNTAGQWRSKEHESQKIKHSR
jgi:hypothetical protein